MDPFDMNRNSFSSSEQQEDDIFMELDDDARYDAYNGEEFGRLTQVVDPNVGHEYLCDQPSTSRNNGRKRKSQSTYPSAKKVSRIVWKEQHEPLYMPAHESELLKISAGASSFTNAVTLPDANYIKDEPTSSFEPSFTSVVTVPDAKNVRDETIFIQPPVKPEDQSGMLLSNDGRNNSSANISATTTFPEEVLDRAQKQSIPKQRYSCSYIDYSKRGIIECHKCGKSFSHFNLFKQHHKKFDS